MEQRSIDAAVKDAQVLLSREEYASGMEQKMHPENDVALKDAQILSLKEECA